MESDNNSLIFIDNDLLNEIKSARKKKKYTQNDVADMLGISVKKYSRIETSVISSLDEETITKLLNILDISRTNFVNDYGTRCSFTVTSQMRKDLDYLKTSKGFTTLSDTIKYCIEQVLNDFFMQKVSVEITDTICDVIGNTYIKEIQKLAHENELKDILIARLSKETSFDVRELKAEMERIYSDVNHMKKY